MQNFLIFRVWSWVWVWAALINSSHSAFAALTLDEAFSAALAKSESAQQGTERINQADDRIDRIRGSLFPEFSFNTNHLIQPAPEDPIARQFSPSNQTTANLTLTQPIFRGLREFAGMRQQK